VLPLDAAPHLRERVIGITAAIAIGGPDDGDQWIMAPCKRWFGLLRPADARAQTPDL
jgi:hypothetical protein